MIWDQWYGGTSLCLALACSWQAVCLYMTHVYGIWLIKGLSWQLNLDIKITTLAQKWGPRVINHVCASSDTLNMLWSEFTGWWRDYMTPYKQGGSSLMVWLKVDNWEIFSFLSCRGLEEKINTTPSVKTQFNFADSFVRWQINQPCKYKVTASSHSRSIKRGNRETASLALSEGNKIKKSGGRLREDTAPGWEIVQHITSCNTATCCLKRA